MYRVESLSMRGCHEVRISLAPVGYPLSNPGTS